jgi:hypothetical protein
MPGDVVQIRQDVDVSLLGQNLEAEFSVAWPEDPGALTPPPGVSAQYWVEDADGAVVAGPVSVGVETVVEALTQGDYAFTAVIEWSYAAGWEEDDAAAAQPWYTSQLGQASVRTAQVGPFVLSANQVREAGA